MNRSTVRYRNLLPNAVLAICVFIGTVHFLKSAVGAASQESAFQPEKAVQREQTETQNTSGETAKTSTDGATGFASRPRAITTEKYFNWMSRIPDDRTLSNLSLPGTHDSCALHNGLSFGFAKCQSWRLTDQFRAGIRFIDIRCRHLNDRLHIYHGIIDQQKTFEQVCDECRSFLKKHPSECIVMSVKEESTSENTTRTFAATFAEAIRNDKDLWQISESTPQLKQVRRRIVLVDRVGKLGGLKWSDWKRQDDYTAAPDDKARLIRKHLELAAQSGQKLWFINFCSGTLPSQLITPKQYAALSNRAALGFLRQQQWKSSRRIGTVVMDFPGEELIERIIETNFDSAPTE